MDHRETKPANGRVEALDPRPSDCNTNALNYSVLGQAASINLKPDLVSVVTAHMVYFCAFAHSDIFQKTLEN